MEVIIYPTAESVAMHAAELFAHQVGRKPDSVLGLATGSTPVGMYRKLVERHQQQGLDFSRVTTFNLDEYVGLAPSHPQSYHTFMHEHLFRHINVQPQNIYVPAGTAEDYESYCEWYEQQIVEAGGIDLQVLGIGADGHIGFNEPSSSLGSRTRIKTLARQTIEDNSRFFDAIEDVPRYAVTMGVGTILDARRIVLLAQGQNKAEAVAGAIEGPVTASNTASALQMHRDVVFILDEAAASMLRMKDYYQWVQENQANAPARVPAPHFGGSRARH